MTLLQWPSYLLNLYWYIIFLHTVYSSAGKIDSLVSLVYVGSLIFPPVLFFTCIANINSTPVNIYYPKLLSNFCLSWSFV